MDIHCRRTVSPSAIWVAVTNELSRSVVAAVAAIRMPLPAAPVRAGRP
jgi:hypothetical protein